MSKQDATAGSPVAGPLELAKFRAMADGTASDWRVIDAAEREASRLLADRVLGHLRLLSGKHGGFAVDRLTHSLQTATRAERAGESDQYVLCALLHDIGDTLAPANHAEMAAAVLKPFVSPELHWLVAHHAEFQGYYYFHFFGGDRNVRDRYRSHPNFDLTAEFCARYDQTSFDPDYPTSPLDHYEPLVRGLLTSP
ncbi:HD domain-containing protein [Frankia sp. AgB1.9]|uniref:HD domain-containing protein n=1 Tax=unclassified Frankia TaxID=2632575 RepID=UPI001932B267|nr:MULTISPECIES: HD domain-containing protein [unclassified Frankia]MBL7494278.1 HD domain-containing protein [Frankia sp. AgW1.1]MBL7552499.1 HD domain-containing protein [Frankia sp. AgB1.9]MBL7625264.1 HD domain-containing protein [Frankia sp. AgB1.8]